MHVDEPEVDLVREVGEPLTATITIPASAALGRSVKSGPRNAPVRRIRTAATIDVSCVRAPASAPAAVCDAPPDWTNPLLTPASRFETPIAARSRLVSTS